MDILEIIKNNWGKNDFIKISLNKEIKSDIEERTIFLNSYYKKIPLRTRAYVILNDINENNIPRCECGCNKVCAIDKTYPINGFRRYANPECSRKSKTINQKSKNKLEDFNWIYEQRITLKKSIQQIADELNISTIPVKKYLTEHKIDNLMDGRRRNSSSVLVLNNESKLKELYETGLSCEQIGDQLGVSKATISRWMNIYGIEARNCNEYERKIKKVSNEEKSLFEYIESIYDGELIQSNRSILKGKELDIYIPQKNLAIEYNGLYSHYYRPYEKKECLIKGKMYHLNKTLECQEHNIQLLHFFSDEWIFKKDIMKSIISSKLNLNKKIYARKCKIVSVSTYDKNHFLNENHIQGEDKSIIKIGLEYDNELVCIMTFCKSRFNKNYEWELSRFSNKIGINVIGGFSKLLKYFRKNNNGSIISYADRRYSNGNVYIKNGFELLHINSPSYYYVDKSFLKRHNRMKFQKKLIDASDCTEYEKARELGYNKIFDCGTISFGLA